MSSERQMKKIDLETLDREDRKISLGKLRKGIMALGVVLVAAGVAYGAYRLVAGEVVACRFAVNGMYCPACTLTVKEVTEKLPGVVGTDVSLAGQDVTVKFRNNRTDPDEIKGAIVKAGYQAKLDGTSRPSGGRIDDPVVANVNGKLIFSTDMKAPLTIDDPKVSPMNPESVLFSVVGKEILLQAADAKTIVVQPSEIDEEIGNIAKKKGISTEEFLRRDHSKVWFEGKIRAGRSSEAGVAKAFRRGGRARRSGQGRKEPQNAPMGRGPLQGFGRENSRSGCQGTGAVYCWPGRLEDILATYGFQRNRIKGPFVAVALARRCLINSWEKGKKDELRKYRQKIFYTSGFRGFNNSDAYACSGPRRIGVEFFCPCSGSQTHKRSLRFSCHRFSGWKSEVFPIQPVR